MVTGDNEDAFHSNLLEGEHVQVRGSRRPLKALRRRLKAFIAASSLILFVVFAAPSTTNTSSDGYVPGLVSLANAEQAHGVRSPDEAKRKAEANAKLVGAAAAAASVLEVSMLLPLNTLQTRMQASGLGFAATLQDAFQDGAVNALRQLYKAWPPTAAMVGMRYGLTFGSGAAIKKHLPDSWPEMLRDASSMALSAFLCTGFLFPMDTLKTRLQVGSSLPGLSQFYQGFAPALNHAVMSKALWLATCNHLERSMPDPQSAVLQQAKHLVCGGLTSALVTCAVFPLETAKKRLQVSDGKQHKMIKDMYKMLGEDGLRRFYRGISMKLTTQFAQGAVFNAMFVACSRSLEALVQANETGHSSV